jgi:hypothetical protein
MIVRILIFGGLLLACACQGEQNFVPVSPPETVAKLNAYWEKAGPVSNPAAEGSPVESDQALRRVLVEKAVERGLADSFPVRFAYRRALAQRLLKVVFDEQHSPATVSDKTWREIYNEPSVFPLFDHKDTFFVIDAQLICCSGNAELCEQDDQTQICLQDFEPAIWKIQKDLAGNKYESDEDYRNATMQARIESPDIQIQEYSFQYDFTKSHDDQKGYTRVDRAVAFRAKEAGIRTVSNPTRSRFGWHVIYVTKYLPEIHLPFGDPEVMTTLKEKFYESILRRDVITLLGSTFDKGQVQVFEDAIHNIDWAKVTGYR